MLRKQWNSKAHARVTDPFIREDIATCQKKGKTILLSIGGATYSEGGFDSEESAQAGAESVWKTFGPGGNGSSSDSTPSQSTTKAMAQSTSGQAPTQGQSYGQQKGTAQGQNAGQVQSTSQGQGSSQGQGYGQGQSYGQEQSYDQGQSYDQNQDYGQAQDYSQGQGNGQQSSYWDQSDFVRRSFGASSSVHRPFGNVVVDGFDLDFEASTSNMNAFAQRLRDLMDAESDRKYFLTAAPQCPYPDAADKDFLNGPGPVSMDAVFVQFYNNPCGLGSFQNGGVKTQSTFNFQTWDNWAKDGSKNKDVKVLLGVPASKDAATNGFVSAKDLEPIIDYAKKFDSFGGVMVWEASQADANKGFLSSVGKALKGTPSRVKRYAFRRN